MFNKIIKLAHKKCSKLEFPENGLQFYEVVVKHASRNSAAPAPVTITAPAVAPANSDSQNPSPAAPPPNSTVIEPLLPLRDVDESEHRALILRKIQGCCFLCDFSDTVDSVNERETKRQTLEELIETIHSGSFGFSENQEDLINMVSVNIFRCPPPSPHGTEYLEPDEDDRYLDPSWPHLQLVYDILLRYVVSPEVDVKTSKRYIDHVFVTKLIDLFDSEDMREREYLKNILHRIYGKYMGHRPFIRNAINDVFYRFVFETQRHNGISELLEIHASIINGFALPMKEEHKQFLIRTLIPLHKPKSLSFYHEQLTHCVVQFVEKDNRLADPVIKGMLKYWPVSNSRKEVLFLGELELVLEAAQCTDSLRCIASLFRQIGRCLGSSQFQVAERAFFLWSNEYFVNLVAQNRNVILPVIFEALEKNMKGHWSRVVQGLTANVRKMFLEMDTELFEECQRQYIEKEAKTIELEEKRELTWEKLEAEAAQSLREDMVN
ncbi:serine/threonine protein phosphatase 2A 57 kDa regulatory subunit B' beta isoform-like [Vigna umbellata]|uniref:serine/threonine protein phosphatase 2A 57 kDa regulatory subunit B' beta isoform-like n=1 Tax=Vigna umbellata TaxID=87088 RepID=UPI001F5FACA3|nr:serine/threonine protein phosphatase 2A 57 kDa regulatory subunit B' beta isoform-like [Vigna umbellata]